MERNHMPLLTPKVLLQIYTFFSHSGTPPPDTDMPPPPPPPDTGMPPTKPPPGLYTPFQVFLACVKLFTNIFLYFYLHLCIKPSKKHQFPFCETIVLFSIENECS